MRQSTKDNKDFNFSAIGGALEGSKTSAGLDKFRRSITSKMETYLDKLQKVYFKMYPRGKKDPRDFEAIKPKFLS